MPLNLRMSSVEMQLPRSLNLSRNRQLRTQANRQYQRHTLGNNRHRQHTQVQINLLVNLVL